jgi:hypothetical protein
LIPGGRGVRLCDFPGGVFYLLCIAHCPFIHIDTAWVGLPVAMRAGGGCLLLATLILKLDDIPVRAWPSRRFLHMGSRKPAPVTKHA